MEELLACVALCVRLNFQILTIYLDVSGIRTYQGAIVAAQKAGLINTGFLCLSYNDYAASLWRFAACFAALAGGFVLKAESFT